MPNARLVATREFDAGELSLNIDEVGGQRPRGARNDSAPYVTKEGAAGSFPGQLRVQQDRKFPSSRR